MVFFIIRHVLEMSKDMTMFSNVSVTQKGVITSFLIVHSSMAFDLMGFLRLRCELLGYRKSKPAFVSERS